MYIVPSCKLYMPGIFKTSYYFFLVFVQFDSEAETSIIGKSLEMFRFFM